jgi:rhomboid family GlyGly-CTERM serine protease
MAPATTNDPIAGKPVRGLWRPWGALAVAGLALVVWGWPVLAEFFIYDRALIRQGQVWRLWTGHVVHFGGSHLFWDLAVFVPVAGWLECLWPRRARWFYLWCPLAISVALFGFDPALVRYGGLSGLAAGMVVLLAGLQLRSGKDGRRWLWLGVFVLVGAKLGYEQVAGAPLVVTSFGDNVRSVPLAHLGGAVCGVVGCLGGSFRSVRKSC